VNTLLVCCYVVAGIANIALPIALGIGLVKRFRVRWRMWLYGVLVFLLFQVLTRIPAMLMIQSLPSVQQALADPVFLWVFFVCAAFTAGLFEETGRWLALRFVVKPAERTWDSACMLGVGHGGLEAIGVGILQLIALASYLAIVYAPAETVAQWGESLAAARAQYDALQGWEPLLGAWERVGAMGVQVALTVMVWQSFRGGSRWWWGALALHTLVDLLAMAVMHLGVRWWGGTATMIITECMVTVMGLLGLWLILRLRPTEEPAVPA
jgi:uncharacterized membrane protein YhfC